LIQILITW